MNVPPAPTADHRRQRGRRRRPRTPTPSCQPRVVTTFLAWNKPHGIATAPGRLYIANHTGAGMPGTVSVLDSATGVSIVSPIAVGLAPNGAAYNPLNGMVYVANRDSNNVSVINTTNNRSWRRSPSATDPTASP